MSAQWQLRSVQIAVLVIFLIVGGAFSLSRAFNAGPDEVAHFQFARFVAKYGRLPIALEERLEAGYKSDWPPLFHLLAGMAGRHINLDTPPFVKVAQDNPRLQLVVGHKNIISWRALTTEDPYQSEVLLWYVARWVTLLSGFAGVIATYLLIRASYPDKPWLALNAAALFAFIPTYIGISSVISYEPLLGTLLAFYFLLLFYTVQHPAQSWSYLGLGLLMGAALLTKYTPLPALPILPLLVVWLAYREQWTWRITLVRLILIGLGLILTFGSWFVFTEIHFNRINELGWIQGLLSPFIDSSDETSNRILNAVISGNLGGTNQSKSGDTFLAWAWHVFSGIWGGKWFGWLFLGLWVIAIAGLVRQWTATSQKIRLWILLLGAHITLFGFFPLVRFLMTRDLSTGMGQHILFPAGAAMILLLMLGLRAWLSPANLTKLLAVVAVLYLRVNLIRWDRSNEAAWPVQTVPLSADEQVLTTFGDISLIDYDHVADGQMLSTTLYWRTEAFLNEDYLIELTLLDTGNQPRARWSGQPLNGRYPTRAWQPGDRIRNSIQIPVAGLPPGNYQVQLHLLAETGAIQPGEANEPPAKHIVRNHDSFSLGEVTLTPLSDFNVDEIQLGTQKIGYTLWHQNGSDTARPIFGERATIIFSTREDLENDIYLSLIGPDEQPHQSVDRVGYIHSFRVEPYFATGEYRLRFEQRSGDNLINYAETDVLLRIETEERQFEAGSISYPLNANFAGHISLLGYDLPQRRVQAGGKLPVTLHWQALKTISADLVMFNHLTNENQELWGGKDRRPRNIYSTFLWPQVKL
jgi:4-amino-4-deoxy-L-arabinose transferase-like glycosyltransferase